MLINNLIYCDERFVDEPRGAPGRDCYRNYRSMTESNYATERNESGVSPYTVSTRRETIFVSRARNRHVITRRVELTNVVLMRPRAAYVDLGTAGCRETRKSLPFNKSRCESPDCAILPGGRNASTDVKPVVNQEPRTESEPNINSTIERPPRPAESCLTHPISNLILIAR